MKINKLPVESELAIDDDGNVTGWFETPAAPNTRYTISFNTGEVATPVEEIEEVEEIDLTGVAEQPGGDPASEQVQMPDNSVADVTPNTPDTDSGTVASDDKPTG